MPSEVDPEDPTGSTFKHWGDTFWKEFYDLFNEVFDLPPEERQRAINAACVNKPDLKTALLDAFDGVEGEDDFDKEVEAIIEEVMTPQPPPEDTLLHQDINDDLLILENLDGGGQGTVYKAYQKSLKREVAVKVIDKVFLDPAVRVDLGVREAQTIAQLEHPNICVIYSISQTPAGLPFMVMEYMRGETLATRLDRDGALALDESIDILLDVCKGINKAHKEGVVHLDIKPPNIMWHGSGVVKVMDFGLSKFRSKGESRRGGTRTYMSPEQWRGEDAGYASDIWALGVVFMEMLAGAHPFMENGQLPDEFKQSITDLDKPIPYKVDLDKMPAGAQQVIDKCLQKRPEDRYTTVRALIEDLEALKVTAAQPNTRPWLKLVPVLAGIALLVALAYAVISEGPIFASGEVVPGLMGVYVADDGLDTDPDLKVTTTWVVQQLERFFTEIDHDGIRYVSSDELNGVQSASQARSIKPFDDLLVVKGTAIDTLMELSLGLIDAETQEVTRTLPLSLNGSLDSRLKNIVETASALFDISMTEDDKSLHIYGRKTTPGVRDKFRRATLSLETVEDVAELDFPIGLLVQAQREDSLFALVHVALSELYHWRSVDRPGEYGDEYDLFVEHARIASDLDEEDLLPKWWSLTQAYLFSSQGNYTAAISTLQLAVADDPSNTEAVLALADAYRNDFQFEKARDVLMNADTSKIEILHELGETAFMEGNYLDARTRFEAILELEPRDLESLRNVGATYQMQWYLEREPALYDAALSSYDQVLAIGEDHIAYLNRGSLKDWMGRHMQKAGDSTAAVQQFREAVADYEAAIELRQQHYLTYIYRASALQEIPEKSDEVPGVYEDAIQLGERYIAINPSDKRAQLYVSIAHLELGHAEEGEKYLDQAKAIEEIDTSLDRNFLYADSLLTTLIINN